MLLALLLPALAGLAPALAADRDGGRSLPVLEGVYIAAPASRQTIHSNRGRVEVRVTGAPDGPVFQAVLDGNAVGEPSPSPHFVLEGVDRGTHRLEVILLGPDGFMAGKTPAVEFHVWQASRLFPNRQGAR